MLSIATERVVLYALGCFTRTIVYVNDIVSTYRPIYAIIILNAWLITQHSISRVTTFFVLALKRRIKSLEKLDVEYWAMIV